MNQFLPNHPAFVHFPIALLCAAWLLEVLAVAARRPALAATARVALLLGALGALVAMGTGLWGEPLTEGKPDSIERMSELHKNVGIVVGVLAALLGLWRLLVPGALAGWRRGAFLAGLTVVVALVLYSGHLGGQLVYDHGVGVTIGHRAFGSPDLPAESLQPHEEGDHEGGEREGEHREGERH